jgi:hypothetical protein
MEGLATLTQQLGYGLASNDDEVVIYPSHTITVGEGDNIRFSQVLDINGEPFIISKPNKMGFDLTPKDKNIARKTTG